MVRSDLSAVVMAEQASMKIRHVLAIVDSLCEMETLARHCQWCSGCPICFGKVLDAEM
jgi:hypothetical protein